jgi:hypothetical protein
MESAMDPSKKFTTHFVSARFEDLSPEVVKRLERFVTMVEHREDVTDAAEMAPLLA